MICLKEACCTQRNGILALNWFVAHFARASELLASYQQSNPDYFDQTDLVLPQEKVDPTYKLAKTYFDLKEYHRAAHVLQRSVDQKSFFLRNYCLFLVHI